MIPSSVNRDWLIEKHQLFDLIANLKEKACDIKPNTTTSQKRYALAGVSFGDLTTKMLNGEISYYFEQNDKQPLSLKQFVPVFNSNDVTDNEYISPKEATVRLGVNINAIYDFIKLGYLESEKRQVNRTPRPVKMIPTRSIKSFKHHYLLTREIRDIKTTDIVEVSGPEIDGCCVKVYSISHLN